MKINQRTMTIRERNKGEHTKAHLFPEAEWERREWIITVPRAIKNSYGNQPKFIKKMIEGEETCCAEDEKGHIIIILLGPIPQKGHWMTNLAKSSRGFGGSFCSDCGKKIDKKSKRCFDCHAKYRILK